MVGVYSGVYITGSLSKVSMLYAFRTGSIEYKGSPMALKSSCFRSLILQVGMRGCQLKASLHPIKPITSTKPINPVS